MPIDHFIRSPCGSFDLVEQHGDFNSESYRSNFAFYLFTYLRGFRELIDTLMLDERFHCVELIEGYIRAERVSIDALIQPQWRNALPKKAYWANCHGNQIDRICEGKPMRIDRGLQAMLALHVVFSKSSEQKLRDINIFEFVRLVPAIYALKDLTNPGREWLRGNAADERARKRYDRLIARLCPDPASAKGKQIARAKGFLGDVAAGHALTFENATMICREVRRISRNAEVVILSSRMEGGRRPRQGAQSQMRCCDNEAEFIRLSTPEVERIKALSSQQKPLQMGR